MPGNGDIIQDGGAKLASQLSAGTLSAGSSSAAAPFNMPSGRGCGSAPAAILAVNNWSFSLFVTFHVIGVPNYVFCDLKLNINCSSSTL